MSLQNTIKFFSSLVLAVLIYFVGFQQGCSPVVFDTLEPLSCEEFPNQSRCERVRVEAPKPTPTGSDELPQPATELPQPAAELPQPAAELPQAFWKYNYEVSLGEVAFLFVIDNSGSMAVEHRNLSDQLSRFLQSIKYLKYHIAVITTDISSSPGNQVKGAYYQDGKFIPIGERLFLTNENLGSSPSSSVIQDFKKALEREETIKCDKRNQPRKEGNKYDRYYEENEISCPSSDERGTYAINLAVQNPMYRSFFNRDHVMFIVVSDEDIRSGEDFYEQLDFEEYQLEDKDSPEVLVNEIFKIFPKSRNFSFHPIIIPPRDRDCLEKQNRNADGGFGSGRGYYGKQYARLARPNADFSQYRNLVRGNIISICDRNYRTQLEKISLFAQKSRIPLPCENPESVFLYVNGQKVSSEKKIEGSTLNITSSREVKLSSRLEVEVYCKEQRN